MPSTAFNISLRLILNVFLTFLFQPISPDSLFCSSCQYIFGRIYFWCAFILQPASSLVRIGNLRIIRHITFTHFHGKRTTCSEWTSRSEERRVGKECRCRRDERR